MLPLWGIRIASDPSAGAGHRSRCQAIAAHLPKPTHLFLDPGSIPNGLPTTIEHATDSLDAMIHDAEHGTINAALIDSYVVARQHIDHLADRVFTVCIADDGTRHGRADIVVPGLTPAAGPALCAGPQFAPLSPAYGTAHDAAVRTPWRQNRHPHLLIAFGARDSANCTAKALDAIGRLATPVQTTIILGRTAPHLGIIADQAQTMTSTDLVIEPTDMIALYTRSDLAIGAPGVSFLERLCCGLPSLLLCQNQAQRPIAAAAARQGLAAAPAGDDVGAIAASLAALLSDPGQLARLRQAGLQKVDGRGAQRLAWALEAARQRQSA